MDSDQFDSLTRALSSRRTALGGLLGGGLAALLGLAVPEEVSAHNLLPGCNKLPDPKKRQACRQRARRHNRLRHTCRPQSKAATCAGRCGTYRNNCNKPVTCPCPAGKTCLNNGSCAQTCERENPLSCPSGCACVRATVEGGNYCALSLDCPELPQECTSTTECRLGQHCGGTDCEDKPNPYRCAPLCQR